MDYKLKKYEWIIYLIMGALGFVMIVVPIALVIDGTMSMDVNITNGNKIFEDEKVISVVKMIFMGSWLIIWALIEGLLIHLLKIIKRLKNNGVFIEGNKQSIKKMTKYLIIFGVISVIFGILNLNAISIQSTYKISPSDTGVGVFTFLSMTSIQISLYTVVLIIIYILINIVRYVFEEALKVKEINNEIV